MDYPRLEEESQKCAVYERNKIERPCSRRKADNNMIVQTDCTSRKHTLYFENTDRRVQLTRVESKEFEIWFDRKKKETST